MKPTRQDAGCFEARPQSVRRRGAPSRGEQAARCRASPERIDAARARSGRWPARDEQRPRRTARRADRGAAAQGHQARTGRGDRRRPGCRRRRRPGVPTRSLITSNATGGSGGINTAAYSRDTGGGGLAGRPRRRWSKASPAAAVAAARRRRSRTAVRRPGPGVGGAGGTAGRRHVQRGGSGKASRSIEDVQARLRAQQGLRFTRSTTGRCATNRRCRAGSCSN